jgi:DNA-binding GntR family transcriptional regulator
MARRSGEPGFNRFCPLVGLHITALSYPEISGLYKKRPLCSISSFAVRKELRDITLVRTDLETRALRLAIERGDLAWETALVSAHHRLARTPMRTSDDPHHTSEDWAQAHVDFHEALLAGCDVPLLLDLCRTLRNATELYRRWSAPAADRKHQQRNVAGEHQAILDATLARDLEKATTLLAQHYQRTQNLLLEARIALPDGYHNRQVTE